MTFAIASVPVGFRSAIGYFIIGCSYDLHLAKFVHSIEIVIVKLWSLMLVAHRIMGKFWIWGGRGGWLSFLLGGCCFYSRKLTKSE